MSRDIEDVAREIVDAAVQVHRALGPGLLESAYQQCFAYELTKRGLQVENEIVVPIIYDKVEIGTGFRLDTLVEKQVIVEHKAVDQVFPIHEAQLLTYHKLTGHRLGFLLNWNVLLMKHGIKRMIYDKK